MAEPLFQAQNDIGARVAKVRGLVSEFVQMPQRSPQCRMVKALVPPRRGTKTNDLNRRDFVFWPTASTVAEAIPERKLASRVNANNTVRSYEREPSANSTPPVEGRHAGNSTKASAES